ncbi:LPD7 domain-containing protein [Xenorhabdus budapestensis]|uniref:MobB relaxase/mobilization protein n=1 Tax=Xenorhabdus budapestensis TaxID=290110 RepID=A0A2D0IT94_XENBU|nr:LPD7 domain-containing protein [Xenorhabdus budapestensis]PHM25079.1 MobB relaxase/mobilization protein [Xenorhabdus budapestensis]
MLIRCRGYNSGVKEYLEEGQKAGREFSRDELDERVILDGNLDLTERVYKSIPDKGQDRYLTFTLSFKEDQVDEEVLSAITQEFKSFLMKAYSPDEFNFYAEAHLPKIKTMKDRKTGEMVDRKPHIHIVIPRKNLLSGNEINPVGNYKQNEKYFEAFQEYINQKYGLESPRDNMRATPTSYADMLSRYKGDDFRSKNKDFKNQILQRVYHEDIKSRQLFYDLVSQYGEIKIRNAGKPAEYIAVKLKGDKKFTNLKESIFSDDFIVHRRITKPPLEQNVIKSRFSEWERRSAEIKYIDKIASPRFRDKYYESGDDMKSRLLHSSINAFYNAYRGSNDIRSQRQTNNQRSVAETQRGIASPSSDSLQNLSDGNVAGSRSWQGDQVLLPGDARFLMGNKQAVRNSGLRRALSDGRGRISSSSYAGPGGTGYQQRYVAGDRKRSGKLQLTPYPVIPRFKNKIPTLADVNKRAGFLFSAGTITANKSKGVFAKPINADVNSSSLSAWLIRRIKDNAPRQSINNLLRTIDRDFYDIRREVLSDKRFSHEEKNQLISVIHFERLKRKEAVLNKNEGYMMGSKEIRELMSSNNKKMSGFTISAPEPEENQGAKSRFARVMEKIRNPVEYSRAADESRKSVEKQLDVSNLYTKRTRKGHVHYLDKTSDKTLFVDTGKLITMRKNGLSTDSVAIALELAQGRFGSTLNIKGSKAFKEMVVNVVAEKGLDIHFTDKKMNDALELRREALLKARERQSSSTDSETAFTIEGAETAVNKSSHDADMPVNDKPSSDGTENRSTMDDEPLYRSVSQLEGKIVKHGAAPYLHKEGNSDSYYVVLKGKDGKETTQWGVGLKEALKGFRRGQAVALDLKESKPVQIRTRDENGHVSTRDAVRNVWEATKLSATQNSKSKTNKKPGLDNNTNEPELA